MQAATAAWSFCIYCEGTVNLQSENIWAAVKQSDRFPSHKKLLPNNSESAAPVCEVFGASRTAGIDVVPVFGSVCASVYVPGYVPGSASGCVAALNAQICKHSKATSSTSG